MIAVSKPRIALSIGDAAGIGPEICLRAICNPEIRKQCFLIVCGRASVLDYYAKALNLQLPSRGSDWDIAEPGTETLDWLRTIGSNETNELEATLTAIRQRGISKRNAPVPGLVDGDNGADAFLALAEATRLCMTGAADALATAPINKESLKAGGIAFIGHTEMLGGLTGVSDPLTMFETGSLRIFFHSRHVSLRKACDLITPELVYRSILRCSEALKNLGLEQRRLAVAGLNPHCGEHGLFGTEDDDGVLPAVKKAAGEGIWVQGPIGADSVFHQAKTGRFDAVLSLYHDQGHIAAKTLDFDRTISITLGLPFLRSSVDHGTAFDIAGKGIANPTGMFEAIKSASRYVLEKETTN